MKKYIAFLLALLTVLTLGLTACSKTPADESAKSDETETEKEEKKEEETKEPEGDELGTYVDLKDAKAAEEAREAVLYMQDQINAFETIRRDLIVLPCNKQFYDKMEAAIASNRQYVEKYPQVLYTAETYSKGTDMEATWHDIFKMKSAGLNAGFIKNQGWYQTNISTEQGDWYQAIAKDAEEITFDILEATLADMKTAGRTVDKDVLEAFKNVTYDLLTGPCTREGYESVAMWTSQTTDCDCRVIEQIYYDMIGEGLDADGVNQNPYCIEQGRNPYKDVSTEDMKASLQMISDKYTEMAEKYPALETLAKKFADYVANWGTAQ